MRKTRPPTEAASINIGGNTIVVIQSDFMATDGLLINGVGGRETVVIFEVRPSSRSRCTKAATLRIPDARGVVVLSRRHYPLVVTAEHRARYGTVMAFQNGDLLAALRITLPPYPQARGGRDPPLIGDPKS
jgi:hypothetical protein